MIVQYDKNCEINSLEPPCTGGLKSPHTHIGTCRNAKNENSEFCFDCGKNMFQWTKKNHLGHFDWNCLGSRYSIRPNTQNMAILAEKRRLRLKVMLRSPTLWVNLVLSVIGIRLRLIGTHFDHNRYIIKIFIFWFFYRSLWSHAKVLDPPYRGFQNLFFINYHFNLL